jgi:hypothetical protein
MFFDVQAVMQTAHVSKLHIDLHPARVSQDGRGRIFLPRESKALDGLEIPGLEFG